MKQCGNIEKKKTPFQVQLKAARVALRLTQQSFADSIKVPLSTYKSWETSGLCIPNLDNFSKLQTFILNNKTPRTALIIEDLIKEYDKAKGGTEDE